MKVSGRRLDGIPKYVEIAEHFRGLVRSGALKPGDKLPSFMEMREQYGIGQGTLERVHVLLDREGLISREPGRGTFIRLPAARAQTGIIGFSGYGFTLTNTTYWTQIIAGIREALARREMQVLLLDCDSPAGWDKVDGVLMSEWEPELALRWMPEGLPVVSVMVPVPGIPCVLPDDEGGVHAATAQLISLGHRRIGYLTGAKLRSGEDNPVSHRREAGYCQALREAGIRPQADWIRRMPFPENYGETLIRIGRETMLNWLRHGWNESGCTAVIAQNDEVAFGALEALQERGVLVPDDVSVVGFDGVDLCHYAKPHLASVAVPLQQVGATAAQVLLQRIAQPDARAEEIIVPVELRAGESTGRYLGSD